MAKYYCRKGLKFFNFGYIGLDSEIDSIELKKDDELYRYPIQLYKHVVSSVNLKDKDVLEVGSGLGGGASYIIRYEKPKSMIGLDISPHTVDYCNERFSLKGLSFIEGDAENIPYPDRSFDVVLNVESSHSYGSMKKFLSEVFRILRPSGYFLFCDLRDTKQIFTLKESLKRSGLSLLNEQSITENVIKALEKTSTMREDAIKKHLPSFFQKPVFDVTGVKGGKIFESFKSGKSSYVSCVLQKI